MSLRIHIPIQASLFMVLLGLTHDSTNLLYGGLVALPITLIPFVWNYYKKSREPKKL